MVNKKVVYAYFVVMLLISIVGIFLLPTDVVMQVNFSGEANWSLNKYIAIALFFGLGILGGYGALHPNRNDARGYFLMGIILIIYILIFVFNT